MLKILEPFWKGASLGRRAAPLKKGSRIFQIPANGIHRAERCREHWLSSLRNYFYACDVSSEKKGDVFFPARKATDERWGVVHRTKSATYVNSYKSVGWNSKKYPSLKKMRFAPRPPRIKDSVDKCTKKKEIQSQKWQYEIAHMYNYVHRY